MAVCGSVRTLGRWSWTAVTVLGMAIATGCGKGAGPGDALGRITAELDAAAAGGDTACIRAYLAHELPTARALAAQAAAAAGDWDSMPALIKLLEDDDTLVQARAGAACAVLLGMDHGHDPRATPADRARTTQAVARAYQTMQRNPPPQYRD